MNNIRFPLVVFRLFAVCSGLCVCFTTLFSGCGPAYDIITTPPANDGVSLPIKSDLFLGVEVKINGMPADVLLDTGTVLFSLIPPSAIEEFGLVPAGSNPYAGEQLGGVGVCGAVGANASLSDQIYVAERLDVGGVIIENAAFVVLNEEEFNTFESIRVSAILNGSLLAQVDWRIDQYGKQLSLFPLNTLAKPDATAELRLIGPEPPFFLQLQGAPKIGGISTFLKYADSKADAVETLMDTGGGIELAVGENLFDTTGWNLSDLPNVEAGLFAAGGTCMTTRFRAPQVDLGSQTYKSVHSILLPDSEIGLIGWRFFANHETVSVSPNGWWIEFRKGGQTDGNFAAQLKSFGIELSLNPDGNYRVKKVTEGSDAQTDGVQVGEIVRAVNGIATDTLEGKSLLFGPGPMRDGVAVFTLESADGEMRDFELTATPIL